ncbi:DUF4265 domain-containing protein [Melissospora conviva]|uniref:DUF4265 domain-containing protein n=1 Tax=Melissospora conviva TaxID=3388432 RepID=UPI003C250329
MTGSSTSSDRLFQVVFDLPKESPTWPPVSCERLWAAKTQVKLNLALRNVPFYCRGVAYGDIVLVRPDSDRREIVFERLLSESGHSAVQILVKAPEFRADLEGLLSDFGASWETANSGTYYAVDIKPETDYAALRLKLMAAKEGEGIGLRESAISECHRAQLPAFP